MEIDTPIKIFLSHPSDEYTDKVKDILKKVPIQKKLYIFPNYDKLELDFVDAIQQTIEEVDLFMVILNEKGRSKQWVNQEVGVAVAKDKDIVVLAEKDAIDNNKLEGFINEKNRTIIAIDKDDSEEKLIQWLKKYTEEHEMIFLQRVLLMDLKKLRRIAMVQIEKYRGKPDNQQKLFIIFHNLAKQVRRIYQYIKIDDVIRIKGLIAIKDIIKEAQKYELETRGIVIKTAKNFTSWVNNLDIISKIDRYIELRETEY
jgi:hypothetical protein